MSTRPLSPLASSSTLLVAIAGEITRRLWPPNLRLRTRGGRACVSFISKRQGVLIKKKGWYSDQKRERRKNRTVFVSLFPNLLNGFLDVSIFYPRSICKLKEDLTRAVVGGETATRCRWQRGRVWTKRNKGIGKSTIRAFISLVSTDVSLVPPSC